MAQWEPVKVTSPSGQVTIESRQVGLSPGQTAGEVGGTYVTRPSDYDPSTVYRVPSQEQLALKRQMIESAHATWESPEEYRRRAAEIRQFAPLRTRESILVSSQPSQEQKARELMYIQGKKTPPAAFSEPVKAAPVTYPSTPIDRRPTVPYAGTYTMPTDPTAVTHPGWIPPALPRQSKEQKVLAGTRGGEFALASQQWGERIISRIEEKEKGFVDQPIAAQATTAIHFAPIKLGAGLISGAGFVAGGIGAAVEKPAEFIKETPGALHKTYYEMPHALASPITTPIEKRGWVVGGAESVGTLGAMYIGGRAMGRGVKAGGDIVRGGIDMSKTVARPTIKITQTNEPFAVRGMAVLVKKKYAAKLELVKKKPKDPETIRADIADKLMKDKKVEIVEKETRAGTTGQWETRYEAASKKPAVKLMSAAERAEVMGKIKQSGGLYGATKSPTKPSSSQIAAITAGMATAQKAQAKQSASELSIQKSMAIQEKDSGTLQVSQPTQRAFVIQKVSTPTESTILKDVKSDTLQISRTPYQIVPSPTYTKEDIFVTPDPTPTPSPVPTTTPTPTPTPTPTTYTPPYSPPTPYPDIIPPRTKIRLLPLEEEEPGDKRRKKDKKKGKSLLSDTGKPDYWFPASLESVTREEMTTGKRAVHIKKKATAQKLYGRLVKTGKPIPTKRQLKASDLL